MNLEMDLLKSELEQVQKLDREAVRSKDQKVMTPNETLVMRSRPESRMEVDEASRATGRFSLDGFAGEQTSEDLES